MRCCWRAPREKRLLVYWSPMKIRSRFVFVAVLALVLAPATTGATPYATRGTCAGYPRVDLQTRSGTCVALLADASAGLRFPRRVLEIAPGRFWLVDMGSWEAGHGRLLEFMLPSTGPAAPLTFTVLADKLDRPLGLVRGPDGRVYIGDAGRIWRTAVGAPGTPVHGETVIDGLPSTGTHPLKEIVFGAGGKLYINVGSSTDACRDEAGVAKLPCPDLEGERPRAAIYEATLGGRDFTPQAMRSYSRGLRNSVALAYVAGANVLLQGENSIDYPDEASPFEKLDVLRDGANYGWPYCVGAREPARGYEKRFDCATTEAPAMLWPAHAAPLHMIAVPAGAKNAFAGQLVVAWHGYRAAGHRVMSFTLDAAGKPTGASQTWIDGWTALAGVRPLGAPTGLCIDAAGRLLIVEDRNRTLLMLVPETR
jgi:glucose/arabinose dehydrogenase